MIKACKWLGTAFIILGSLLAALTTLPWNFISIAIGAVFHLIPSAIAKDKALIVNWVFTLITMIIAAWRFQ